MKYYYYYKNECCCTKDVAIKTRKIDKELEKSTDWQKITNHKYLPYYVKKVVEV